MRFEVTSVLDAIERHLTTHALLAQAVVDLGEIAWFDALDGGRSVNLLRTGMMIDALSRHLGEDAVMVYPVAGRALLTDADLTSKERMVLGRWASDGVIEVVPEIADRVPEVADLTGLPVITRHGYPRMADRYPWLASQPDRVFTIGAGEGGARLSGAPPGPARPSAAGEAVLGRAWRCPRRDCPSFGDRRIATPSVPRMRAGVPTCPRHDEPLTNAGSHPPAVTFTLIVNGRIRDRFVVRAGRSVVVGRSPEDPDGVAIGMHLSGEAAALISRNHVRLDLREDAVVVSDLSTNGTVIRSRMSPYAQHDDVHLTGGPAYPLKPWDSVMLHDHVAVCRADSQHSKHSQPGAVIGSVMDDAPTIAMTPRFPRS